MNPKEPIYLASFPIQDHPAMCDIELIGSNAILLDDPKESALAKNYSR